jgi:hypothetical protein
VKKSILEALESVYTWIHTQLCLLPFDICHITIYLPTYYLPTHRCSRAALALACTSSLPPSLLVFFVFVVVVVVVLLAVARVLALALAATTTVLATCTYKPWF